jgi:hypothetical protein
MKNKGIWFIWFVILCLLLFASIFVSRTLKLNPYVVDGVIGVIITIGALLHYHLSGNIKKYPVDSFTVVWKDNKDGDPILFQEGIKSDMTFYPWEDITKLYVTTVDFRQGMTVVIVDQHGHVKAMQVFDMDGFKNSLAQVSKFRIDNITVPTGC